MSMKRIGSVVITLQLLCATVYAQADTAKTHVNSGTDQVVYSLFLQPQASMGDEAQDTVAVLFGNESIGMLPVPDSTKQKKTIFNSSYSKFIVPTTLLVFGVIGTISGDIDSRVQQIVIANNLKHVRVDDFLQFAPIAAVYTLDFAGVKAKHNFRDRTFVAAVSYIVMGRVMPFIKAQTRVLRPDESNDLSFPSGHTATAFVGAHILFREYNHASPWIYVSGYAAATATGIMRITNNKHWVSDVAAGAGVGMLCVELSYLTLPLFQKIAGTSKNNHTLVALPTIGKKNYSAELVYTF